MPLDLLEPDSGAVSLFGRAPADAVAAGSIGVMLQTGSMIHDLSVRELVVMLASVYPSPLSIDHVLDGGKTVLFATHYLEEADQAADRILVINRGRLLADGTPAEIKARAGAKRLSFRLDQVDEPFLLGLPGLVNLEVRHDVVQIQSSDSDATLYAIIDAGYRPREIEVTSLGLEQAFLAITAEDDATNGHAAGETN